MEKQFTLAEGDGTDSRRGETVKTVLRRAAAMMTAPCRMLRRYYSDVLGTEVSAAAARAMTEAQAAFFVTAVPADCPLAVRVAACLWLIAALKRAKRAWDDKP